MKKLLLILAIPVLAGLAFLTWQNLPSKRFAKHISKARLYVKEDNLVAARSEYEKAYNAQGKFSPHASFEVLGVTNRMSFQDRKPREAYENTLQFVQANPKNKEAKILLAQMAFQIGETEAAFNAVDTVLEMDPWYFPARLLLANVRAKQGRPDLAEEQLRFLAEKYPDSVEALLPMAEVLLLVGQVEESGNFLGKILAKNPKNARARLLMVDSFLRQRKLDSAQAYLDSWMEVDVEHQQQLQIRKARIYSINNQVREAIAALSGYSEKKEVNAQALSELALFYAQAGLYDSALAIYHSLGDILPAARQKIETLKFYLYLKNQNPARALESLKMLQISDKRQALIPPLIAAYMAIGQENKAQTIIQEQPDSLQKVLNDFKGQLLLDKDFIGQWALITYYGLNKSDLMAYMSVKDFYSRWPKSLLAINLYTGQLSSVGSFAEAAKILSTVEKPNLTQQVALLQLFAKSQQSEKMLKLAEKISSENPTLKGINNTLADYWVKKDKAKAFRYYDKELAVNPDNLVALNNVAWEFGITQANLEKASPYLEKLKTKQNLDPRILDTIGWILAVNGKYPEAEKHIRNALDLVPDYPAFQYHLAYILNALGKKAEARKFLDSALASKRPFEERQEAEKLLAQLG